MSIKKSLSAVSDFVYRFVGSNKLFYVVVAFLIINSAWLIFSAVYPMPFDEFAHVGAIQIYSEQFSPVVSEQSISTGIVGDITRTPSFLYYWLMSFPFRILDNFLSFNQTVMFMRLLNLAMVVGGIVIFRKLLLEWKLSKRLVNVVLLAFVATPIVSFLSSHVNYDNFMFLLTPIVLLYASRLIASNKNMTLNVLAVYFFGLTATLAKQTFLPILILIVGYVSAVVVARNWKQWSVYRHQWQKTSKNFFFFLLLIASLVVSVLAVERYGRNIVDYGSYRPKCNQVQPVEFCEKFGPWYRDNIHNIEYKPSQPPYGNPFSYSQYWVTRMMRGYFAIFHHNPSAIVTEREPYGPIQTKKLLPIQINFAIVVAILGVIFTLINLKKLGRNKYLRFGLVLVIGFIVIQWIFNYTSYLRIWKAEAIQARYTVPLLLILMAIIAQSVNLSISKRFVKSFLVVIILAFYVYGGGSVGWVLRANTGWKWDNSVNQTINRQAQYILRRTVIN